MKHIIAALALGLLVGGAAQAATIANGGFETGPTPGGFTTLNSGNTAVNGWTVTSGSIDYIGSYWTASEGSRSLDMSGTTAGAISTTISDLVAGRSYTLFFDLAGNPAGGPAIKTLMVSVDALMQSFTFTTTGKTQGAMGWLTQSLGFVATAPTATLTFTSQTATAYGPALDNVRIETAAVPLPAGGLLFVSALAGLAALRRRKTA